MRSNVRYVWRRKFTIRAPTRMRKQTRARVCPPIISSSAENVWMVEAKRELNGEEEERDRSAKARGMGKERAKKPIIRENTAGLSSPELRPRRSDDDSPLFYSFPSWRLLREKLHRRLEILWPICSTIVGRRSMAAQWLLTPPRWNLRVCYLASRERRVYLSSYSLLDNPRGLLILR